jgi:MFS family permease
VTRAIERRWVPAYSLFLLFLSNVLNVADRALLGVVVDPIKADLQLSDTEISIVSGSAFVVFNLVAGLLIARWVDRGNRKLILVIGIAMWSAATAMTGVAQGFSSLAVSRVLVGVGEATAFPVAISMIGDLFTADRRPRAISIYQASIFVGLVLGTILAGVLAAAHGWRAMFLVCGGAGFLVAILLLATLVEPSRSQDAAAGAEAGAMGLNSAIAKLLRARGFVLLSLGAALSTIAGGVLQVWAPTFLLRSHGVSLAAVGALIGPTVGIGGIAGTLLSGVLASQLVRRRGDERGGLLVPLIATPARRAILRDIRDGALAQRHDGRGGCDEFSPVDVTSALYRGGHRHCATADASGFVHPDAADLGCNRWCFGAVARWCGERCVRAHLRRGFIAVCPRDHDAYPRDRGSIAVGCVQAHAANIERQNSSRDGARNVENKARRLVVRSPPLGANGPCAGGDRQQNGDDRSNKRDFQGALRAGQDGEPLPPHSLSLQFRRQLARVADVPQIRFHDLRHTHASQRLVAGAHAQAPMRRSCKSALGTRRSR